MIDVRFATTLQMSLSLALAHEAGIARLSSAQLAEGTGTHASLVRRLLPLLADAGIITSAHGRDGGVSLARPAEAISLADIYVATVGRQPLWRSRGDVPHRCVVSSNMDAFFAEVGREAEQAVIDALGQRTLATSLRELRRIGGLEAPAPRLAAAVAKSPK